MFFKPSSSMFFYGLIIFFIGADSTTIPVVLEETIKPEGLGTVSTVQTSEFINQPTTDYFTPKEEITKGQSSGENISQSKVVNVARDLDELDYDNFFKTPGLEDKRKSSSKSKENKREKARESSVHLFKTGTYESPRPSVKGKKSLRMQFRMSDKIDESIQHYIDQESKGQNKFFLFNNKVGDEQAFRPFGKEKSGDANKSHFLFNDGVGEAKRLTLSSPFRDSPSQPEENFWMT